MKSFNEHIDNKPKKLKEDPLDDLGSLLTVAAVGGGLWAMKKSWDKWGKGSALANMLAVTKKQKAKVAQDKIDKADAKQKDKEAMAQADALGKEKDEDGNLVKQKDAQAYKDKTGKAPSGWKTSPEDSPSKGEVWTVDDQSKWDQEKVAKDAADKAATDQAAADKEKKADADKQKKIDKEKEKGQKDKAQRDKRAAGKQSLGKVDKEKQAALKQKLKDKRAKAAPEEFQKFALHELIGLSTEDRTQLLEELVLEETMSLEESQELQAIMALDDAGIKADINRKGQVVIKKKDKKKAHIALEKSFKKGGWPPLKLEDVDEHKGTEPHKHPHEDEELDEASSKKARNKAADEIEKIADKGGAEAPTLFSLASKLRKGTHSTTGLKLSKQVTAILKDNGIKEEVDLNTYQEMKMSMAAKKKRALWAKTAAGKKSAKKSKIRAKKVRAGSIKIDKAKGRKMAMARKKGGIRDAYEIVSEARNRAKENKPEWETEDSRLS